MQATPGAVMVQGVAVAAKDVSRGGGSSSSPHLLISSDRAGTGRKKKKKKAPAADCLPFEAEGGAVAGQEGAVEGEGAEEGEGDGRKDKQGKERRKGKPKKDKWGAVIEKGEHSPRWEDWRISVTTWLAEELGCLPDLRSL